MPASAAAATTISVNETEDAALESGATSCISEAAGKGCTLRAAIELADNEGGEFTINLPEGKFKETHSPSTLTIAPEAKISIVGAGAEKTTIEGDQERSVFQIEDEGSLTIDGVTVTHGLGGDEGGAFYAPDSGSLTVEKSTITENEANDEGGAIYARGDGSVTIKQSTISKNTAGDEGGAIYLEGSTALTIEGSTLTENKAGRKGGAISNGGANPTNTSILISDSTIQKNTSEEHGGGLAVALVESSGCLQPTTKLADSVAPAEGLTVEKSTITENTAEGGNGGGVYLSVSNFVRCAAKVGPNTAGARPAQVSAGGGQVLISQSAITDNRAEEGNFEGPQGGEGGGIYEEGPFNAVDPIINSTIAGNVAQRNGGGVVATEHAVVVLISDTVFGNTVEERVQPGTKRLQNNTVVESSGPGNNLLAQEEESGDSTILLRNTIVAEPESGPSENCQGDIESMDQGLGYNLDYPSNSLADSSADTCGMSEAEHDLVGVKPQLSPEGLHENGGPTETIALLSTSPAIGFVPVKEDCEEPATKGGPASVDQRGEKRPGLAGKGCDVGAYEYQEPPKKKEEPPKKEETPPSKETPTTLTPSTPSPAAHGVLAFKAVEQCASKRDITIHIQHIKRLGIISAVVSINGKNTRTLTGKHLLTAINLIGLPKGTFTIEIVAHTHSGHVLRGQRLYHTCHTKLPGHSYLPL
jgi:predicted outer membrane repeat protein